LLTEEQRLNIKGLQVVGVETKVRDLLSTAKKCVAAGMHIHLDKPAGASLPKMRAILGEAAGRHLAVQMGYLYRKAIKTSVSQGTRATSETRLTLRKSFATKKTPTSATNTITKCNARYCRQPKCRQTEMQLY